MGFATRSLAVERRASPENPATSLANPAAWLMDWMGGGKTKSGARISEQSAMTISGVWAAVRLLANAVAMTPIKTYRRLPRGKEAVTDHPAYRLLHDRPNPEMTPFTFKQTLQAHAVVWGGAFAEIEYSNSRVPIALWPLLPHKTRAERRNGQKIYITRVGGEDIPLAADRVMHIPGLSYDGVMGYRLVSMARESLGLAKAVEEDAANFFGNGSRVSGVLHTDKALGDKAYNQIRESWERMHSGLSNSQRVAILEEGLKWQQIGISPEDAQNLESRKFSVSEVARWIGVPPHMIGDLERSTNNNIEEQGLEFLRYSLNSWLVQWEQTASFDLFREEERQTMFAEFVRLALLQGDSVKRGQFYREMFHVGAISPNEIRERENMNPFDGGDLHLLPLNMGTPGQLEGQESDPFQRGAVLLEAAGPRLLSDGEPRALPAPEVGTVSLAEYREKRSIDARQKIRQTFEPLLEDVGDVVFSREINAATRALNKAFGERGVPEFDQWITEFYATYPEFATERFGRTIRAMSEAIYGEAAAELESDAEYSSEVEEFTTRYLSKMGERERSSSVGQLRKIMAETPPEEVEAALRLRLDEWKEKRAKKFAKRTAARTANAMARESYKALGVERLKWVAVGKSCPLCRQMDGKTVAITGAFLRKGETVTADDDGETQPLTTKKIIRHPPLHPQGCDCTVAPG